MVRHEDHLKELLPQEWEEEEFTLQINPNSK
jgi:hypothetical protein